MSRACGALPPSDAAARCEHLAVVIPTKDRPQDLCRLVNSLLSQSYPPSEIVVVDQSASEHSRRAVETACAARAEGVVPELIYIHEPAIDGAAAARNEGLRRSAAPCVLFFDDDAVPVRDCLLLLSQALARHPNLVAVAGIISNYKPPPLGVRLFRRFFYRGAFWDERQPIYWKASDLAPGQIIAAGRLNGGCMAFRRDVLLGAGAFDPRYRGASVGEDVEISKRLLRFGKRKSPLAFVGGALISHKSVGAWKARDRLLEFEIVAAHYWYRKNLPLTLGNSLRFTWMCLGIVLWAFFTASRRRDLQPLRSVLAGLRCVRSEYQGCPFLRPPAQAEHCGAGGTEGALD